MKRLISVLVLAFFLANLSAQSVYDMEKKDMITIVGLKMGHKYYNPDTILIIPTFFWEKYGRNVLRAFCNNDRLVLDGKTKCVFSSWGFSIGYIENIYDLLNSHRDIIQRYFDRTLIYNQKHKISFSPHGFECQRVTRLLFWSPSPGYYYSIIVSVSIVRCSIFFYALILFSVFLFVFIVLIWLSGSSFFRSTEEGN